MLKRWSTNIGSALAWLLVSLLALVLLAVAEGLYQMFLVTTMRVGRYSNTLWLDLFFVLAGLLWLGFVIFMEHVMFSASSHAGLLLSRTLFIVGFELIALALLQFGQNLYGVFSWSDGLIEALELLAGCVLLWFARRKPQAQLSS